VRQHTFWAAVTLDAAGGSFPRGRPGGTHAGMVHACLVQSIRQRYFPAVISGDEEAPLGSGARAVVTIALAGDEPEAFFPPGQHFTIWADGMVGHAIRPEGLVGYGVIFCREPLPPVRTDGAGLRRRAAGAARRHSLDAAGALAASDPRLVV
jgi:hypothetical protein